MTIAPDDGKLVRMVEIMGGLSKENDDESLGDGCELDAIRQSLPSTEDASLHRTVEADNQREASHADNPTLVESEYPSEA